MIKKLLLLLISLNSFGLAAQEYNDSLKTKNKVIKSLGFFASPEIQLTQLNYSTQPFIGGNIAILFNSNLAVGLVAYQHVPNLIASEQIISKSYSAGFQLEQTIITKSRYSISIPIQLGKILTSINNQTPPQNDDFTNRENGFEFENGHHRPPFDKDANRTENRFPPNLTNASHYYAQPGIRFNLQLMQFVKLSVGINYRMVWGNFQENFPNNELNGLGFIAGLKMGYFSKK